MRHFLLTSSAASSIRSVHWGKKKISKAWTCVEMFLTWGLFSLSCTLVSYGASFSQVAGRVCMTLRGTIHGSGCHLHICCLKKKYKIIRSHKSQVKRTKAASQYVVLSDFETGFFQAIHLPESLPEAPPGLTQFSVGYPVSRLVHQGGQTPFYKKGSITIKRLSNRSSGYVLQKDQDQ